MSVTLVKLKVGHTSERLTKKTPDGHDYRWTVFVRPLSGGDFADQSLVHKVIFNLHTSFERPTRVLKEPPFEVTETGYGSFTMQIIIILANDKKKEYPIQYELILTNTPHYETSTIQRIAIQNHTPPEFLAAIRRYSGGEGPSSQRSSDASPDSKEPKMRTTSNRYSTSSLFDSNQTSSSSSSSQSSNSSDSSDSEGEKKRKLLKKKTKEMQRDDDKPTKFHKPKDTPPKSTKKKVAMKDVVVKNSPASSTTTSVTPASTPGTSSTSKDPRATPTTPDNRSVKKERSLTPPMRNGGLRLSEVPIIPNFPPKTKNKESGKQKRKERDKKRSGDELTQSNSIPKRVKQESESSSSRIDQPSSSYQSAINGKPPKEKEKEKTEKTQETTRARVKDEKEIKKEIKEEKIDEKEKEKERTKKEPKVNGKEMNGVNGINGSANGGKTREELERSIGRRLKTLQEGTVDTQTLFDVSILLVKEGPATLNGTSLEYDLSAYSMAALHKIYHRLRKGKS